VKRRAGSMRWRQHPRPGGFLLGDAGVGRGDYVFCGRALVRADDSNRLANSFQSVAIWIDDGSCVVSLPISQPQTRRSVISAPVSKGRSVEAVNSLFNDLPGVAAPLRSDHILTHHYDGDWALAARRGIIPELPARIG
jgi:hypothetical protein